MFVRCVGETFGALLPGEFLDNIVDLIGGFRQYAGTEPQAAIGVLSEFAIELALLHSGFWGSLGIRGGFLPFFQH